MSDSEDGDSSRSGFTRRQILMAAGGAAGTASVATGALSGSGSDHLVGGDMALDEAGKVAGKLWMGPEAGRSDVEPKARRVYMASDTQVQYYGDGDSWTKMGHGTPEEPVPAGHYESLDTDETVTETLQYDHGDNFPQHPRQPERPSPINIEPYPGISNPIIDGSAVDDAGAVGGVADPFLSFEGGKIHLFAEVFGDTLDIGHWTSPNFTDWTYDQIVLSDGHSFPYHINWGGEWYMMPNDGNTDTVSIYRANSYPADWPSTPTEQPITDPTGRVNDLVIFRFNGRWWCLYEDNNNDLRIWYSDKTESGPISRSWSEHPASPDTSGINRPRGRPIVHDDWVDLFAQPDTTLYRVSELTTNSFSATQYRDGKVHRESGSDRTDGTHWDQTATHHVDAMMGTHLGTDAVIVDGNDGTGSEGYSLGLFTTSDTFNPAFKAIKTSGQPTTSGNATDIQWDAIEYDYGRNGSYTNYEIGKSGFYRVEAVIQWDTPSGSDFECFMQLKDGTSNGLGRLAGQDRSRKNHDGNSDMTQRVSWEGRLTEGQNIKATVIQYSGGSLNVRGTGGAFTVRRVR